MLFADQHLNILSPIVQYLFAGLCGVLLTILTIVLWKLFGIIKSLMEDRDNHTSALTKAVKKAEEELVAVGQQIYAVDLMVQGASSRVEALQMRVANLPCDQYHDRIRQLERKKLENET